MKQLILFLMLLTLWTSCKKDGDKQKEILLSEISTNGVVNTRIQYSAGNKLSRYESYSGNALNAYLTFEYDANGHIAEVSSFSAPGDIPIIRILFQCDGQGKITNATNYDLQGPSPNTPISVSTYSYNAQNLLNKVERRDDNDEFISSINLSYFPDGNLKEMQTFEEESNQLWMTRRSVFSVPNGFYPKGVDQLKAILGPDVTASFFSEAIHDYTYDQNGGLMTHRSRLMSGREFNDDGSLKKQVQTFTSIKPPQPAVVSNQAFEYILQ